MSVARILVVDDESGFRELCVDLLTDAGFEVEAAGDGQTALERLSQSPFQMVLTDINMPVMDGMALLQNVKARFPLIEVVLMTAFGGLQSALEALRFGAYDYITNPFTREGLVVTVRRCL
ncbi:MAG: response regulator [Elusimicrobia bacterium]|nr:response regulator [Elusimicrobiota bacterium]